MATQLSHRATGPRLQLENNRRASLLGLILPGIVMLAGGVMLALANGALRGGSPHSGWLGGLAGILLVVGLSAAGAVVYWSCLPRMTYRDGQLWLQLKLGPADRIPIEIVECFFIGQGPGEGNFGHRSRPEAVNLVVRLAESAREWHHGEVRPALGSWCDGYITLRGMWCEPLDGDRVGQLNHALIAVKRSLGLRP